MFRIRVSLGICKWITILGAKRLPMITNNAQSVESRFSDSVSINRGMFSSISFPSIIFLVALNIKVVRSPWLYRLSTQSLIEIKRRWTNQHAQRSWNSARRTTGDEKDCRIGDKDVQSLENRSFWRYSIFNTLSKWLNRETEDSQRRLENTA